MHQTHTHIRQLPAILPREPGLAGSLLILPYILFNTVLPFPSQKEEKGEQWRKRSGGKIHSTCRIQHKRPITVSLCAGSTRQNARVRSGGWRWPAASAEMTPRSRCQWQAKHHVGTRQEEHSSRLEPSRMEIGWWTDLGFLHWTF